MYALDVHVTGKGQPGYRVDNKPVRSRLLTDKVYRFDSTIHPDDQAATYAAAAATHNVNCFLTTGYARPATDDTVELTATLKPFKRRSWMKPLNYSFIRVY